MAKPTYLWRKLTTTQRESLMAWRKQQGLPWHRPPHCASEKIRYHVTAACFEHRPYIGRDEERMRVFCGTLLEAFKTHGALIHAWCVLPNHSHALIETADAGTAQGSSVSTLQRVPQLPHPEGWTPNQDVPRGSGILAVLAELGKMHGRLSFAWNGEEKTRGRQVWCGAVERYMRNDAHIWATINYVHHNPVHHGYVERWQDWPFSSAREYLDAMGKPRAEELWREYPILDYGKGWDDAKM
jgi:putative transposase